MTNRPDVVARRLASQKWGRPARQHKLAKGIWRYTTPESGGIVVDTFWRPEMKQFFRAQMVYAHAKSPRFYYAEQHFLALEQDCDEQVAEWVYADIIFTPKLYKRCETTLDFEAWKEQQLNLIRSSLRRWHPEVLKKYPVPGKRKITKE